MLSFTSLYLVENTGIYDVEIISDYIPLFPSNNQ